MDILAADDSARTRCGLVAGEAGGRRTGPEARGPRSARAVQPRLSARACWRGACVPGGERVRRRGGAAASPALDHRDRVRRAHKCSGRRRRRRRRPGDRRPTADGGGGIGEERKKREVGEPKQPVANVLVEEVNELQQVRGDSGGHLWVHLNKKLTREPDGNLV